MTQSNCTPFPLLAGLLALTIFSCNRESEQQQNTETQVVNDNECFAYHLEKDSAAIHINAGLDAVKGDLSYSFFEKDRNRGTFEGSWHGDTLYALYTFSSEGTTSVREVAYIRKAEALVEGFGPVEMKGDSVFFKDKKKLQFENGLTFKKVACPKSL